MYPSTHQFFTISGMFLLFLCFKSIFYLAELCFDLVLLAGLALFTCPVQVTCVYMGRGLINVNLIGYVVILSRVTVMTFVLKWMWYSQKLGGARCHKRIQFGMTMTTILSGKSWRERKGCNTPCQEVWTNRVDLSSASLKHLGMSGTERTLTGSEYSLKLRSKWVVSVVSACGSCVRRWWSHCQCVCVCVCVCVCILVLRIGLGLLNMYGVICGIISPSLLQVWAAFRSTGMVSA